MSTNNRIKIGVVPVKRDITDFQQAKQQKEIILDRINKIKHKDVEIINVDSIVEGGVFYKPGNLAKVEEKLKQENIDALFMPHCDFGTEEVVGRLGKAMGVPFLLWGSRDSGPDPATGMRKTDTQCGVLASSKVLQRYGVPFSYIVNSSVDSEEFERGFNKFTRVASVVKSFKNLRIAQLSTRPKTFMSVIWDEGELLNKFGIEIVPISIIDIMKKVEELVATNSDRLREAIEEIKARVDCSNLDDVSMEKVAALKLALLDDIEANDCQAAAIECWSLFPKALNIRPCFVISELTDMGIPVACETDINGAVTSIMLQAAAMGETPTFFADLTIRHPENDNAELLWHCGPFPYSIKAEDSKAKIDNMCRAEWGLKSGEITIARFDSIAGDYSLLSGNAMGIDGPRTFGTYLWMEVDDWSKWEEKIVFGPYIHHVVGIHGDYSQVLMEACKYIPGLKKDPINPVPLTL